MGTPDFAVPSLDILVKAGYDIVGVITSTDKYGGRGGKKLIESAVKKYAQDQGLRILQPKNLKNPDFVEEVRALKADLQVVVAFRMLPEVIWNMPLIGTINLHGSLLPKYRGAAPINWAVIRGEKETGVTTFFLQHEIDTGNLLMQRSLPIGPNETAGDVHDRMMEMGAEVVLDSVRLIETGDYELTPQDDSLVTKAPKIFHDTCQIDFCQSAESIHDFIRGLSPYPTAWTMLNDQKLKVYRTVITELESKRAPGDLEILPDKRLCLNTETHLLEVLELQLQGRRRMQAKDFVNGYGDLVSN